MEVKEIKNIHEASTKNVGEISFSVSSITENPVIDWEERFFLESSLEIYTGTGQTGTQLTANVDYEFILKNDNLSSISTADVYGGINIINASYLDTDLYVPDASLDIFGDYVDETDINRLQTQVDQILGGTAQTELGQLLYFSTYKSRASSGLLPFTFDVVSTGQYPELYAEIGDTFEQAHIDAGQSASATGYFYPTPVPGSYGRSALPDIEFSNLDFLTGNNVITVDHIGVRSGSAFKFELTSGSFPTTTPAISDGDTVYVTSVTNTQFNIYTNEADAINGSGGEFILFDTNATGTFKLTQAGIAIDDAFQGHEHTQNQPTSPTGGSLMVGIASVGSGLSENGTTTATVADGTNGDVNPTNETRPVTYYEFGYIKAENVIPFEGTPVSGVKYDTSAISRTIYSGQQITINHNLDTTFEDLTITFLIRGDITNGKWFKMGSFAFDGGDSTSRQEGYGFYENDNNSFYIQTGAFGIYIPALGSGSSLAFNSSITNGAYRVIVEKKNYISPILDQPKYTNKVETLADGDSVSLTAQNTIINVTPTTADAYISVGNTEYAGQTFSVNNLGTSGYKVIINGDASRGIYVNNIYISDGLSARGSVITDDTLGVLSFFNETTADYTVGVQTLKLGSKGDMKIIISDSVTTLSSLTGAWGSTSGLMYYGDTTYTFAKAFTSIENESSLPTLAAFAGFAKTRNTTTTEYRQAVLYQNTGVNVSFKTSIEGKY